MFKERRVLLWAAGVEGSKGHGIDFEGLQIFSQAKWEGIEETLEILTHKVNMHKTAEIEFSTSIEPFRISDN